MLQIVNNTPFSTSFFISPNEKGIDTLYIVVKATYTMDGLKITEDQLPVVMADEFWGEASESSLKYASEMHLTKPTSDIVVIGHACASENQKVQELDVKVSVGKKSKTIKVFGDRKWTSGIVGLKPSPPVPFETMPLTYERAYGGTHIPDPKKETILSEQYNPIGKGFKGKKNTSEMKDTWLPNLEDPKNLITSPKDTPKPVCFGYVAPNWEPRISYAGTYDKNWQKKKAPYLPTDFDPRFFNCAHPDMITDKYLTGGEAVKIENMSSKGPIAFNLPQKTVQVSVSIAGQTVSPHLNLETVLLEPNENRFAMVWRTEIECDKKALKIKSIIIDPVSEEHV